MNLQPPYDNVRVDARVIPCRLQDVNLQPPYDNVRVYARVIPCRLQDLNLQPPYYKYGALPIAPSRQFDKSIGHGHAGLQVRLASARSALRGVAQTPGRSRCRISRPSP